MPHPIQVIVTDDLQRSRLTVFFRGLLAIPHIVVLYLWTILADIAIVVAWFVALIAGRVPDGLHSFIASYLRYTAHVGGYLALLANPYPPFSGATATQSTWRSRRPRRRAGSRRSSGSSSRSRP